MMDNEKLMKWQSDIKLRLLWTQIEICWIQSACSVDSFVRRYQYTKHRQMHSNPMACAVDKTITSPGSLNVALHLSAWTDRRMVGADVFDGFRIGFMSAKRSCLGEMLQWEGNHANATYCTRFFSICRFVISVVELNFPMLLCFWLVWNIMKRRYYVLVCMASFREEVLLAAVAVGVGATFSAPVGGVLWPGIDVDWCRSVSIRGPVSSWTAHGQKNCFSYPKLMEIVFQWWWRQGSSYILIVSDCVICVLIWSRRVFRSDKVCLGADDAAALWHVVLFCVFLCFNLWNLRRLAGTVFCSRQWCIRDLSALDRISRLHISWWFQPDHQNQVDNIFLHFLGTCNDFMTLMSWWHPIREYPIALDEPGYATLRSSCVWTCSSLVADSWNPSSTQTSLQKTPSVWEQSFSVCISRCKEGT